jgi:hypothetical protein
MTNQSPTEPEYSAGGIRYLTTDGKIFANLNTAEEWQQHLDKQMELETFVRGFCTNVK